MDRKIKIVQIVERIFSRLILIMIFAMGIYVADTAYDAYRFSAAGTEGIEYHDFNELLERNPDTVAWIRLDNTRVDHPVVQGKDNYAYLDKDFDGNDYAGGCIFMDASSSRDMTDSYIIIHGHHIEGGAMFGDLEKYLDQTFLDENHSGELLTKDSIYELTVAGAGIFDAYDGGIYYAGPEREMPDELPENCGTRIFSDLSDSDKVIALSTCAGDMTNNRIVVFCSARYTGHNSTQKEID